MSTDLIEVGPRSGRGGFVNEYGLTAKQEAFCSHVARGETQSDAYRLAFDVTSKKYATINVSASKLAAKPKIRERVAMLLKEQEKALHRDAMHIRRHVFQGLMRESVNDEARASERIAALVALGKMDIVGMFSERKVETKVEREAGEIEAELKDKLRAFLSRD